MPSSGLLLTLRFFALLYIWEVHSAFAIRFPERTAIPPPDERGRQLEVAVFALGSFWRSEAVFGCLPGVVRTSVGYSGGSKVNPEFRNLGDHAECVKEMRLRHSTLIAGLLASGVQTITFDGFRPYQFGHVEYDPKVVQFKQLLDVFWSSHDSRQIFGQGPDVGNQYRSIIFTNGTLEARLAAASKEREQTKSRSSIVTTQILQLGMFYPAETEHQKFELKRNKFLLQLIGNMPEDELAKSNLATKLNGYAAELCPSRIQKQIDAKIEEILKSGWPVLRDV